MAKPGLPKQFAKMGFAKGWAAFKRFKGTSGKKPRKATVKVATKKKPTTTKKPIVYSTAKKGASMADSKKTSALKARLSNALKKGRAGIHSPGEAAIAIGEGLGGGIATSYLVGALPTGKMPRPGAIKSVLQLGLGVFLATRKNKHLKYVGFGTAIVGGMSLARELLPVPTFAGEVDSALYGEEFMGEGEYMGEPLAGRGRVHGRPLAGRGRVHGRPLAGRGRVHGRGNHGRRGNHFALLIRK